VKLFYPTDNFVSSSEGWYTANHEWAAMPIPTANVYKYISKAAALS
jgi:hypothetical protein